MKKLHSIITLLAGVLTFTACTSEVDDIFSSSSTDRIKAEMTKTKEVLESAPNGWVMEYYGSLTYGGYNVLMKFDGDNVTVGSEKVGSHHNAGIGTDGKVVTATSHYKFENSQGLVLSFDDYNEIFHYFSDPSNADYGQNGDGMEGDLEFRVISVTPEKIELVGKKHNTRIYMYPVPAEKTWEDYITEISETESFMTSRSYEFVVEGSEREINVTTSYRRLVFEYKDDIGDKKTVVAPYIVTKDGYKMYKTYDVDGTEVSGVVKGETEEFFFLEGNDKARLYTYVPTLSEMFQTNMWFVNYPDLGEFAKPYWDEMREKLKTAGMNGTKNRLIWALFGTYGDKLAFHMQAGSDYCYYGIRVTSLNEEGSEIKIAINTTVNNKPGRDYFKSYGMNRAMVPFSGQGSRGREFTLTTDNKRHPSYIILTDKNEPTNVIKLWANEVDYPYGDLDADK